MWGHVVVSTSSADTWLRRSGNEYEANHWQLAKNLNKVTLDTVFVFLESNLFWLLALAKSGIQ